MNVARTVLALAVAAIPALAVTPQASAAGSCPDSYVCWMETYGGDIWSGTPVLPHGQCQKFGERGPWAAFVQNRNYYPVKFYPTTQCTGNGFVVHGNNAHLVELPFRSGSYSMV
ncbi:hypothetical protein [Nocardia sp. NBC_00403]|uniref:hypothetical protein n=1 Tax=Nocardia sp. NBC_00403 TaxID=2975990 RepID=UPI002E217324